MKRSVLIIGSFVIIFGLVLINTTVQAQPYPNRNIQFINATAAGGGGDIAGRILVEELEKILGVKLIVTNKAGG